MKPLISLSSVVLLTVSACIPGTPLGQATHADRLEILTTLQDRSFRMFKPSVDSEMRKSVILDFFGPVRMWAQYAVGDHAIDEWEIVAHDYRIERNDDFSEVIIHLEGAYTRRILPSDCEDCIPTVGVSISIRDLFRHDKIAFKVNDPNSVLPTPFPIFNSWTRFPEDEYLNGG